MNVKKIVALRHLNFSFLQKKQSFFKDLHVDFSVGRINFIQGKNGIGKSTLLKILSGHMSKDHDLHGFLQIDTHQYDIAQSQKIAEKVAFVTQKFDEMLVPTYSFQENLQFACMKRYPGLQKLSQSQPLPKFIEKYGIDNNVPVSLLSGGQRQILSILMVLERSPKILLLDEPTAALDEENTKLVMDFLRDICDQQNMTIIAIVHDHELVKQYAQQSYFELVIQDGVRQLQNIEV